MTRMSWPQQLCPGDVLCFDRKQRVVTILRHNTPPLGIDADDERVFYFMKKHKQFTAYARRVAAQCGYEAELTDAPRGVIAYELTVPRRQAKPA